jgi:hypothetical protein|nr:MAG TPA: hypothetical protein [Caudoviricetes sp.]
MDAVEFFKTVNRLCKNQRCCAECPIHKNGMGCMIKADDDSTKSIEETVSKVEQWAKDNPVKTRQSEFLKMFPNAKTNTEGVLVVSPCFIDQKMLNGCKGKNVYCNNCRREYWLAEVTDND